MVHIREYIDIVRSEEYPVCQEQKWLVDMVERILEKEKDDIYINEEQVEKYLSYQRYFPFSLFPWEKFLLVLMLCTYTKEDNLPRFSTLFCMVGRGSGKNAFISYLAFCLSTETNGIEDYNISIVANSELQRCKQKLPSMIYTMSLAIQSIKLNSRKISTGIKKR